MYYIYIFRTGIYTKNSVTTENKWIYFDKTPYKSKANRVKELLKIQGHKVKIKFVEYPKWIKKSPPTIL